MAQSHTDTTLTLLDNILKNVYGPGIIPMIKEQSATLSLLETKAGRVALGGKSFILALQLNNMGSTASIAEDGSLPDSLSGQWLQSVVPIKYHYFTVAVTGPAMAMTTQDKFAYAQAWSQEVMVKTRSFRQQINRQICGDGNAILAQVDGTPSIGATYTTITVDNAYGLSGYNSSDVNGARFITPNMKVSFYSGATERNSSAGPATVVAVTKGAYPSTSAYFTVLNANASEVADGDYVYVALSKGYEAAGLRLLIDDNTVASTVQSLSADTYSEWRSAIGYGSTPGTAEALTTNRFQVLIDEVETTNGGNVDFMLTSPAVWLTYGEMARAENMMVNQTTLDTGWTALQFGGKNMFKDPYMVDNIFLVDNRAIKIYEAGTQGWIDQGGIVKQIRGKDAFDATYKWYMNLGVTNRAWCGKMVDISVSANKY